MNKMWECNATIDSDIFLEYVEVWEPTMELAWQDNELGEKELVQLHKNRDGVQKWILI